MVIKHNEMKLEKLEKLENILRHMKTKMWHTKFMRCSKSRRGSLQRSMPALKKKKDLKSTT